MASQSMIRALQALDAAEGKHLYINDFYRALGLTNKGKYLVFNRMEKANMIVRDGDHYTQIHLTFKGMQTLKEAAK